jgi:hypothetical protein
MGMDPEKVINQGGLRRTLLGEEFSDLEFFYARWSPIRGGRTSALPSHQRRGASNPRP